jgi:hypothetical protein
MFYNTVVVQEPESLNALNGGFPPSPSGCLFYSKMKGLDVRVVSDLQAKFYCSTSRSLTRNTESPISPRKMADMEVAVEVSWATMGKCRFQRFGMGGDSV